MTNDLSKVSDQKLLENFSQVVSQEREAIAVVVAHLSEIDKRELYAKEGFSSLFSYCVKKFHYSEQAIYRRIQAARLSQEFPEILDLLETGAIHLTTMTLISPYVKEENKEILLQGVQRKSKQEIETFLASLFPMTRSIPDKIRRLPLPKRETPAQERVSTEPIASSNQNDSLAQNLSLFDQKGEVAQKGTIASDSSNGALEAKRKVRIEFSADESVAIKIEKREKKGGASRKEEPTLRHNKLGKIQTRYIPANIRFQVWKRDGGQCRYQEADGRRCQERGGLEIDHVFPWSLGGDSRLQNLRLLCRTHNGWRNRFSQGQRKMQFAGR